MSEIVHGNSGVRSHLLTPSPTSSASSTSFISNLPTISPPESTISIATNLPAFSSSSGIPPSSITTPESTSLQSSFIIPTRTSEFSATSQPSSQAVVSTTNNESSTTSQSSSVISVGNNKSSTILQSPSIVSTGFSKFSATSQPSSILSTANHKSLSTSMVAGSVVGSVAALAISILTIFGLLRRRRRARSQCISAGAITPLTEGGPESLIPTNQPESTDTTGSSSRQEKGSQLTPPISSPYQSPPLPEPTSLLGDSAVALPELGDGHTMQPVEARLDFLQNTVAWMIGQVQQLQAQREYDGDFMMGRSDAPPPTYVSE
ncbi:hypothetical protein GYMLUDRAFT_248224 [Collybiopsis luxurians FD-317 M1]|uniref:Transmembrane protein n=1 Tax=Collybiopsis luxurians FD-317 M1 TaxID=944289 RepID=A0A0D0CDB1_9AGAR|nr:hypothetical protein GYMLUDRAFT_248224 [Collybiopsis luxurians FD-317 M1]